MFKGLNDLLRMAADLAESVQDEHATVEVRRTGGTGIPRTLHAAYGVSVRVCPRVAPATPFGHARKHQPPDAEEAREPLADVLDEGDHYVILVELPGAGASAVEWSVRDERVVVIRAGSSLRTYSKKFLLPVPVNVRAAVSTFENGIFELKLPKQ